jgi:integrase
MALFKRGKIWWYEFEAGGARVRESARTTVRSQAVQREVIRKAEILLEKQPSKPEASSVGFSSFAYNEFSTWCANEHREKPSTCARYMRSIKALAEFLGDKTLGAIDSGWVEKYKLHRSRQKRKNARDGRLVSPAAINRDLAVLRILFSFAIRLRKASHNPVGEVRFLKETSRYLRVLTSAEEARYLQAASPLLKDVAVVMLEAGMRPGEVCSLRVSDIDIKGESVYIRAGKTPNATRFIPLTRRALAVFQKRISAAITEWLFPCPHDASKPVHEVRKAHDAAVRRSGIHPHFRLYDLRHTALSRMAMAGIDLATLKELAGHSQIQMTMRYVHPTPEHKRRAVDKFERFRENLVTHCVNSQNDSGPRSEEPVHLDQFASLEKVVFGPTG